MRRKQVLCAVSVCIACLLGLALVPSLGRADDILSLGQPAEDEGVVVVLDDANEEADPGALDDGVLDVPDDIVVFPEDADEPAEEVVLVGQDAQVDEPAAADEAREVTEAAAPALMAQASADVNDLLATVTSPTVMYRTHVQTYGWQAYQSNGKMSGTSGQSKRLEAIELGVNVPGVSGGIAYRVHRQTYGWESGWKKNGATSGTVGESKRLEAIMIKLTGNLAKQYNVKYRVHVQTYGWQGWVKNGALAGTTGESKRLEAIQIKLVAKKNASSNTPVTPTTPSETSQQELKPIAGSLVDYNVRLQEDGWGTTVADGAMAGATGEGKGLAAIRIALGPGVTGGIQYCSFVDTYGWEESWVADGALSGTSSEDKHLEAVRIQLTGNAEKAYDVWYRVHAQTYGWLGWATNGESAGTAGRSKRLEAIEVKLLPKGSAAPGTTLRHLIQSSLFYLDAGHGLSGTSGDDPGSADNGYVEADLTKDLANRVADYTLKRYGITVYNNVGCDVPYGKRQAHAQSVGATAYVSLHFNAAGSSATGIESYIFEAEPGYAGEAAPRSKELQNIIHPKIVKALGIRDRGKFGAAFSVLNGAKTGIPAVLVEVCFITNVQDMRTYQNKKTEVAKAIAEGIYEATQEGF